VESFLSSGQLLRLSNKGYAGYLKSRETERSFFFYSFRGIKVIKQFGAFLIELRMEGFVNHLSILS